MKKRQCSPETEAIYRSVHIQKFNAPYVEGGADEPKQDDPSNLRKTALEMFQKARFDDFINLVQEEQPDWRDSDVTLHLVGAAYQYAKRYTDAQLCLNPALEQRRMHNPIRAAETLVVLGRNSFDLGQRTLAWQYLDEAQELAPQLLSVNVNRLSFAALDERLMEETYGRMNELYPRWFKDTAFCERVRQDGEIARGRGFRIWNTILSKMQHGENTPRTRSRNSGGGGNSGGFSLCITGKDRLIAAAAPSI